MVTLNWLPETVWLYIAITFPSVITVTTTWCAVSRPFVTVGGCQETMRRVGSFVICIATMFVTRPGGSGERKRKQIWCHWSR